MDSDSSHGGSPPLVVVAGSTASGKSHLALDLAEQFGGEIINFDSVQLYQGFDIGAAKTSPAERRDIPHHLLDVIALDVLQAGKVFSAGDYCRMAREVAGEVAARGRLPILTGGTGFYLKAFLDGLPPLPGRDEALRTRLVRREQRRPGSLYRLLGRLAPDAAAEISPADLQKQIRALEIRLLTGAARPSPESATALTGFRVLQIGLDPDRAELAEVIRRRTAEMFEHGLLEEVRRLLAAGLTGEEKPFEAIGYRQALACVRGEMELDTAKESVEIETRQYAKRQRTWFRRDPRIVWLPGFGSDPAVIHQARELVQGLLDGNVIAQADAGSGLD